MTRQSITIVDSSRPPTALNPVVSYDPVLRTVTLSRQEGAPWLLPDQPYKVVMHVPESDDDPYGLRAIDRAPIFSGDPNRQIGFLTTKETGTPFSEPRASFCRDVLPVFQRSCSASTCHGSPTQTLDKARFPDGMSRPAAGLILDTSAGVLNTALNRVANGSNTGALAGQGHPAGRMFGIDMPIVDPGAPGNSWLMYKVLLAVPADPATARPAIRAKCDGTNGTPPIDPFTAPTDPSVPTYAPLAFSTPMDDFERGVLSDAILGREMPYPDMGRSGPVTSNPGLTISELERLRLWMAQGAHVEDCGACQP